MNQWAFVGVHFKCLLFNLPGDSVLEEHDAAVARVLPSRLRADHDRVALVLEGLGHEVVLGKVLPENLERQEAQMSCL